MLSEQRLSRWSCPLVGLCALLLSGTSWLIFGSGEADLAVAKGDPDRPRLVVMVMFDQLRGDYLERWDGLFGDDGFKRLEREGAWFQNCHYPYAHTVTAAGHASVLSGAWPARHGVVDNDWYDRQAGEMVNCVTSDRYQRVPPKAGSNAAGKARAKTGVSPERMLAPTLGDALKKATGGRSKVVSLSFKDRSAALPAGRRPDACYWLDSGSGAFVTSTYYRDRLHNWVADFNRGKPADHWAGKSWDRLRSDIDYEAYSGPDDVVGEGRGALQGRTFPHPMPEGLLYYQALYSSPFGNELLLELVKRALVAEKLGAGDVPDLLCVSFSSNDPIGHIWGPDSQEVLDVTLRTDLIVRELLTSLDEHVGKGRYVLALSADHGVCPLPEVARAKGLDGARVPAGLLGLQAEEFLQRTFGGDKARWIEATVAPSIYLNQRVLRQRGLKSAEVEEALAGWLRQQPDVQFAYTRAQLTSRDVPNDELTEMVQRSFHPERSGDVTIVVKPYHLIWMVLTGSSHGSPHAYDTHVPLLVYGPGIRAGIWQERVTPLATAAILARAVGIKPPGAAQYPVPDGLFSTPPN